MPVSGLAKRCLCSAGPPFASADREKSVVLKALPQSQSIVSCMPRLRTVNANISLVTFYI